MHSLDKLGELRTARYSFTNNARHSDAQKKFVLQTMLVDRKALSLSLYCATHININNLFAFSSTITHLAGPAFERLHCALSGNACGGCNECYLLDDEQCERKESLQCCSGASTQLRSNF